jgi:hypothetical protein
VIHTNINHLNRDKTLQRIGLSIHLKGRVGGKRKQIHLYGSSEAARKYTHNLKSPEEVCRASAERWADPPLTSLSASRERKSSNSVSAGSANLQIVQ